MCEGDKRMRYLRKYTRDVLNLRVFVHSISTITTTKNRKKKINGHFYAFMNGLCCCC